MIHNKLGRVEWIEKGEQTKQTILRWLIDFGCSNTTMLTCITGLSDYGIKKALKRLLIEGFIFAVAESDNIKNVWGITWKGVCEAGEIDENMVFNDADFNVSQMYHKLCIQNARAILESKGLEYVCPDVKFLRDKEAHVDGFYRKNGELIAIEVENSAKSKKRYKEVWGAHIKAINKGMYSGVHYFLVDKNVLRLQRIFDEMDTVYINDKTVPFTAEVKSRFLFDDVLDQLIVKKPRLVM
jgi:hypothetical protein